MVEIDVCRIPRQCLCLAIIDSFVPAEFTDRPGIVKVLMEPLPMFGGVRKRNVEDQSHDFLAACISYVRCNIGRIETYDLNRASCGCCGAGRCALCMGERGKYEGR
jgi:hypothetical protein